MENSSATSYYAPAL